MMNLLVAADLGPQTIVATATSSLLGRADAYVLVLPERALLERFFIRDPVALGEPRRGERRALGIPGTGVPGDGGAGLFLRRVLRLLGATGQQQGHCEGAEDGGDRIGQPAGLAVVTAAAVAAHLSS